MSFLCIKRLQTENDFKISNQDTLENNNQTLPKLKENPSDFNILSELDSPDSGERAGETEAKQIEETETGNSDTSEVRETKDQSRNEGMSKGDYVQAMFGRIRDHVSDLIIEFLEARFNSTFRKDLSKPLLD